METLDVAEVARLVGAQIAELDTRTAELADTRALLSSVLSRIDRGEPIDVATLCSLISKGSTMDNNWKAISDRYLSDDAKAQMHAALAKMPQDFDQEAYSAQWTDLAGRIETALPMDPHSADAKAFYAEWVALLAPFTAVATPAMMQGVGKMYDGMHNWQDEQKPPFSPAVWDFIKSVGPAPAAQG